MRFWVLLVLYAAELIASLWFAYELRYDFLVGPEAQRERLIVLLWIVPLQLVCLGLFHQMNTCWDTSARRTWRGCFMR